MRSITRRGFVTSSLVLAGGLLLPPGIAKAEASSEGTDRPCVEIEGSAEARALWDKAVKQADAESGFQKTKHENDRWDIDVPAATAAAPITKTVSTAKNVTIGIVPDTIIISANYSVSGNQVVAMNWADFVTSVSTVTRSNYDYRMIDGGRTIAIYYHAVMEMIGVKPTYVGDFYAEFYYSFTGRIY